MKRPRLRGMQLARAVFAAQFAVGLVAAGLWALGRDLTSAVAALFGALIAVIPGFFFALRLLTHDRSASTKRIAWSLYIGEVGKLALTIGLFTAAVMLFGSQFLPVITTFAACLLCYWLALVINR